MSEQERVPIAWKAIESKTPVFSKEGEAVAKVAKIVGDSDADVFTGLAISTNPLSAERFVEADHVVGIWPDRVDLDLTKDEIEHLPEHEEVPAVRWRPGEGGFFSRLFGRF